MAMRKLLGLGLVGLTGCANFCDTFFKARNVCRDQTAQTVAAPMVMSGTVYGCSQTVVCSGPIVCSGSVIAGQPMSTDVFSPALCDGGCVGEPVMSAPVMSAPVATAVAAPVIMSTPITTIPAGAAQPVSSESAGSSSSDGSAKRPHPLLNPIRWMREHHQSKQ